MKIQKYLLGIVSLIIFLCVSNSFSQGIELWDLPNAAKARIGKGKAYIRSSFFQMVIVLLLRRQSVFGYTICELMNYWIYLQDIHAQ